MQTSGTSAVSVQQEGEQGRNRTLPLDLVPCVTRVLMQRVAIYQQKLGVETLLIQRVN